MLRCGVSDSIAIVGGLAWSCLIDTHNEVRFAVGTLSGRLLDTIYAEFWESVRWVPVG